jgi:hypothetical protein
MEHPELDLPPEWAWLVMPRRDGRANPEPIRVDTEAADRIDRLATENFQLVESFFPPVFADRRLRDATARHLSTAPDPTGAAVLHLILGSLVAQEHQFGPFLDAWISKHGPAFAAAAVLERCMMSSGYLVGMDVRRVAEDESGGLAWAAECDRADLRRLRAAIADAADYQAVTEILNERRTGPWRNTVAAFLVPTETSWVDEALDAAFPNAFAVEWMLWHAVATPDHLARLEGRTGWPSRADTGMLATFLDGCGVAGLPTLASRVPTSGWGPAERPDLAAALTSAASPEAMRRLLTHLEVKGAVPLAGAVVRRFPAMAVRVIAERAADHDAHPELRVLLPSDPSVWQRIAPKLSAAELNAVEPLREVGPDTPVASLADLPPVLAVPPWKHLDRAPEPHPPLAPDAPVDLEMRWEAGEEIAWTGGDPATLIEELSSRVLSSASSPPSAAMSLFFTPPRRPRSAVQKKPMRSGSSSRCIACANSIAFSANTMPSSSLASRISVATIDSPCSRWPDGRCQCPFP